MCDAKLTFPLNVFYLRVCSFGSRPSRILQKCVSFGDEFSVSHSGIRDLETGDMSLLTSEEHS